MSGVSNSNFARLYIPSYAGAGAAVALSNTLSTSRYWDVATAAFRDITDTTPALTPYTIAVDAASNISVATIAAKTVADRSPPLVSAFAATPDATGYRVSATARTSDTVSPGAFRAYLLLSTGGFDAAAARAMLLDSNLDGLVERSARYVVTSGYVAGSNLALSLGASNIWSGGAFQALTDATTALVPTLVCMDAASNTTACNLAAVAIPDRSPPVITGFETTVNNYVYSCIWGSVNDGRAGVSAYLLLSSSNIADAASALAVAQVAQSGAEAASVPLLYSATNSLSTVGMSSARLWTGGSTWSNVSAASGSVYANLLAVDAAGNAALSKFVTNGFVTSIAVASAPAGGAQLDSAVSTLATGTKPTYNASTGEFTFNGTSQYFRLYDLDTAADTYGKTVRSNVFTLSMWVNATTWGYPISFRYNTGTDYFGLMWMQTLSTFQTGNSTTNNQVTVTVSIATWHHVAFVFTTSSATMYVDGVSVATTSLMGLPNFPAASTGTVGQYMFIGANNGGTTSVQNSYFAGSMKGFRLYSTALVASDVAAICAAGKDSSPVTTSSVPLAWAAPLAAGYSNYLAAYLDQATTFAPDVTAYVQPVPLPSTLVAAGSNAVALAYTASNVATYTFGNLLPGTAYDFYSISKSATGVFANVYSAGSASNVLTAGSFGLSNFAYAPTSSRQWPPAALTADSCTLSGQTYGNGAYTSAASSTFSASYPAWNAFDYDSGGSPTYWVSAQGSIAGAYITLQLPTSINLSGFTIAAAGAPTTALAPKSYLIYGVSGGVDTPLLTVTSQAYTVGAPYSGGATTITSGFVSVGASVAYSKYKLLVNTTWNGLDHVDIVQWTLYESVDNVSAAGTAAALTWSAPTVSSALAAQPVIAAYRENYGASNLVTASVVGGKFAFLPALGGLVAGTAYKFSVSDATNAGQQLSFTSAIQLPTATTSLPDVTFNGSAYNLSAYSSTVSIIQGSTWSMSFSATATSSARGRLVCFRSSGSAFPLILCTDGDSYINSLPKAAIAFPVGVPSHVVVTNNAGAVTVYINNAAVATDPSTSFSALDAQHLWLGADNGGGTVASGNYYIGTMKNLRFYNKVVSAAEITALYTEGSVGAYATTAYNTSLTGTPGSPGASVTFIPRAVGTVYSYSAGTGSGSDYSYGAAIPVNTAVTSLQLYSGSNPASGALVYASKASVAVGAVPTLQMDFENAIPSTFSMQNGAATYVADAKSGTYSFNISTTNILKTTDATMLAALNSGAGATFSMWLKKTSADADRSQWQPMVYLTSGSSFDYFAIYSNMTQIRAHGWGGLLLAAQTEANPNLSYVNVWRHAVFVCGATDTKLYVDGVLRLTSPYTNAGKVIDGLYIGGQKTYNVNYTNQCYVDDFRMYSTELTAGQIAGIYAGTLATTIPTSLTFGSPSALAPTYNLTTYPGFIPTFSGTTGFSLATLDPGNTVLNTLKTGNFTMSLWFKATFDGTNIGIIAYFTSSANLIYAHTNAGNSINVAPAASFPVVANMYTTWHHLVWTASGNGTVIDGYFDGAKMNTASTNVSSYLSTWTGANILFGQNVSSSYLPAGSQMAKLGVWSRALSAAEVATLYSYGATGPDGTGELQLEPGADYHFYGIQKHPTYGVLSPVPAQAYVRTLYPAVAGLRIPSSAGSTVSIAGTVDATTGASGAYFGLCSVDADNTGSIYVAYQSTSPTPAYTMVKKYNGTTWDLVGTNGYASAAAGAKPKISVDQTDNTVYVCFMDANGYPVVRKFNGTSWVDYGTNPVVSTAVSSQNFMDVDSAGTLYLAFTTSTGVAVYKSAKGSGTWTAISPAATAACSEVALAVDASNNLYMAYAFSTAAAAVVQKYDGSNWSSLGTMGTSAGTIGIAVSPLTGLPGVSTMNGVTSLVELFLYSGSAWSAAIPVNSTIVSSTTSIAADDTGAWYVGYRGDTSGQEEIRKYSGSTWSAFWTASDGTHNIAPARFVYRPNTATLMYAYANSSDKQRPKVVFSRGTVSTATATNASLAWTSPAVSTTAGNALYLAAYTAAQTGLTPAALVAGTVGTVPSSPALLTSFVAATAPSGTGITVSGGVYTFTNATYQSATADSATGYTDFTYVVIAKSAKAALSDFSAQAYFIFQNERRDPDPTGQVGSHLNIMEYPYYSAGVQRTTFQMDGASTVAPAYSGNTTYQAYVMRQRFSATARIRMDVIGANGAVVAYAEDVAIANATNGTYHNLALAATNCTVYTYGGVRRYAGYMADADLASVATYLLYQANGFGTMLSKAVLTGSAVTGTTVVEFPPAPLTANTQTRSGYAYGNGAYALSTTLTAMTGYDVFNMTSADLSLASSFCALNPAHSVNGGNGTQTFDIVYQLPSAIQLTSYKMGNNNSIVQLPTSWTLYGSNDGTSWTSLDVQTGQVFLISVIKSFTVTGASRYSRYKFTMLNANTTENDNAKVNTFGYLGLFGYGSEATAYTLGAGTYGDAALPSGSTLYVYGASKSRYGVLSSVVSGPVAVTTAAAVRSGTGSYAGSSALPISTTTLTSGYSYNASTGDLVTGNTNGSAYLDLTASALSSGTGFTVVVPFKRYTADYPLTFKIIPQYPGNTTTYWQLDDRATSPNTTATIQHVVSGATKIFSQSSILWTDATLSSTAFNLFVYSQDAAGNVCMQVVKADGSGVMKTANAINAGVAMGATPRFEFVYGGNTHPNEHVYFKAPYVVAGALSDASLSAFATDLNGTTLPYVPAMSAYNTTHPSPPWTTYAGTTTAQADGSISGTTYNFSVAMGAYNPTFSFYWVWKSNDSGVGGQKTVTTLYQLIIPGSANKVILQGQLGPNTTALTSYANYYNNAGSSFDLYSNSDVTESNTIGYGIYRIFSMTCDGTSTATYRVQSLDGTVLYTKSASISTPFPATTNALNFVINKFNSSDLFTRSYRYVPGVAMTAAQIAADAYSSVGPALYTALGGPLISTNATNFSSLTLSSTGVPYVAVDDATVTLRRFNIATNPLDFTAQSWGAPSIAPSAGNVYHTCVALDPSGIPYVVFRDESTTPQYKATVMKYVAGTGWVTVGSVGFSAGYTGITRIAFDPSGTPYVAYVDGATTPAYKVTVMKYFGGSWVNVGNAGLSAGAVSANDFNLSLAIDSSGTPFVGYSDGKANVMKYVSGTAWTQVGPANFSGGLAPYACLAIDSSGTPYFAYQDASLANKATVMKLNAGGTAWAAVGTAGFSAADAYNLSLAIDASGTLYLAYRDGSTTPGYKLTVMKSVSGGAWTAVGGVGSSPGTTNYPSIALDATGTPYVAYEDGATTPANKASVVKWTGTSWTNVGSAGLSTGVAEYTTLAINSTGGKVYVAYKGDTGKPNLATISGIATNTWQSVVAAGATGFNGNLNNSSQGTVMRNDELYMAFTDTGNGGRLSVKKYNLGTQTWSTVGTALGFSASTATYVALEFGPDGTLYVAYGDGSTTTTAGRLSVMKIKVGTDASFSYVGSGAGAPLTTAFISGVTLAVDSANNVYVMTYYSGNLTPLVSKYTVGTSTWSLLGGGSLTSSGNAVFSKGMAVDRTTDTVYVTYRTYGGTPGDVWVVKKYAGGAWVDISGTLTSESVNYPSVALDGNNNVYVMGTVGTNGNFVRRLVGSSWVVWGQPQGFYNANNLYFPCPVFDASNNLYVGVRDYPTMKLTVLATSP